MNRVLTFLLAFVSGRHAVDNALGGLDRMVVSLGKATVKITNELNRSYKASDARATAYWAAQSDAASQRETLHAAISRAENAQRKIAALVGPA